jgi:hypothetical protein
MNWAWRSRRNWIRRPRSAGSGPLKRKSEMVVYGQCWKLVVEAGAGRKDGTGALSRVETATGGQVDVAAGRALWGAAVGRNSWEVIVGRWWS